MYIELNMDVKLGISTLLNMTLRQKLVLAPSAILEEIQFYQNKQG